MHQNIDNHIPIKKIIFVLIFNLIITITEFIGGIISKSLALISDSYHNLADSFSIFLTFIGIKISQKKKNSKKTYGYKRGQIIVAFINSLSLIVISLYLIYEGIKKILSPEKIDARLMLIISIIGLFGNFFSILLLKKHTHKNLNIKAGYLHLLSDTLSSIGVIASSIFILIFDIYIIDGIMTIIISSYIIYEGFIVFKKSVDIFMQSSNIDYEKIKESIEKIKGIKDIHHMHAWLLDENTIHFEAHINVDDMYISEISTIYKEIEKTLKKSFNINHITIQPEVNECMDNLECGE